MITYTDHYSFRHDGSGGGEVNIDVKGSFTASGSRAWSAPTTRGDR